MVVGWVPSMVATSAGPRVDYFTELKWINIYETKSHEIDNISRSNIILTSMGRTLDGNWEEKMVASKAILKVERLADPTVASRALGMVGS